MTETIAEFKIDKGKLEVKTDTKKVGKLWIEFDKDIANDCFNRVYTTFKPRQKKYSLPYWFKEKNLIVKKAWIES